MKIKDELKLQIGLLVAAAVSVLGCAENPTTGLGHISAGAALLNVALAIWLTTKTNEDSFV